MFCSKGRSPKPVIKSTAIITHLAPQSGPFSSSPFLSSQAVKTFLPHDWQQNYQPILLYRVGLDLTCSQLSVTPSTYRPSYCLSLPEQLRGAGSSQSPHCTAASGQDRQHLTARTAVPPDSSPRGKEPTTIIISGAPTSKLSGFRHDAVARTVWSLCSSSPAVKSSSPGSKYFTGI